MERLPLRWDPGLRLLAGYGGASRGGGQVLWSQNPEPPRNFGSDCISSGRAGAIPRRRLRTNGCTRWLPTMQPLLCALAGLALLRAGAGEWSQGPRDIPGRRGRKERGSGDRHREKQREGTEMVKETEIEGQKREEIKEKDE